MSWFLIALVAPAVWAAVNYIDEYLIKELDFKPYMLSVFSGIIGGLMVTGIAVLGHGSTFTYMPVLDTLLLFAAGVSIFLFGLFYLYAMEQGEASVVAPLFLFSIVFSYVLGVLFLGEVLSIVPLIGAGLIMGGSLILVTEPGQKLIGKIRPRILVFMMLSSFFAALDAVLFRLVTEPKGDTYFWTATFWQHLGLLSVALSVAFTAWLFAWYEQRKQTSVISVAFESGYKVAGANIMNEALTSIGNITQGFALLLAPAALVITVAEGFQPFFVVLYGLVLALFFPKLFGDNTKRLGAKFVAITIMAVGAALVLAAS